MTSNWWKYGSRLGAIALVGLSAGIARAADDRQPEEPQGVAKQAESPSEPQDRTNFVVPQWVDDTSEAAGEFAVRLPLPEYWLGLDGTPISAAMRSQLKLDGDHGLVVERLVEEGPAARCGLKPYDILFSAGEAKLFGLADLVKVLEEGKDEQIEFQILRDGEQRTVKVKPEKRPEPKAGEDSLQNHTGGNGKAMDILRQQLGKADMPMRMQFFHPGIMLPPGAVTAPIPDDLHLHMDKQGSKPAKIVVELGDKRWETTEDELAKLPDDVRVHVESMLSRMSMPKFEVEVDPNVAATPFNIPVPSDINERLEKRLEELNRRMEKMGEQLNQLRGERDK